MSNHFELLDVSLSSAPTIISFGGGVAEYSFALSDSGYGPEITVATAGTAAIASAGAPIEFPSGAVIDSGETYSSYFYPVPIPYAPQGEVLGLAYTLSDGVHYGYAELAGTTLVGYGNDEQPFGGIGAGFVDLGSQPGLVFYQDIPNADTLLELNADPGSPLISVVEVPVLPGVAFYQVQTWTNGYWAAPFSVQPGTETALPSPGDRVVFEPVDAAGNAVPISGSFNVGLGFASAGQFGATFAEHASITPATTGVYRFFDTGDGTHFFTSSGAERDQLMASRPDLTYEGAGFSAVDLSSYDPNTEAVYRFFSTTDGTHFFTTSASERDSVEASRADLTFEGTGFYEHSIQEAGDSPVYRFFDTLHGTHLYTGDAAEHASILATRPDLTPEGIGFYAPQPG